MATGTAPGKKFKSTNLNAVFSGPPKATATNFGPAVRTAAVIKPKAKPKGLVALGKAAGVGINARKGAAWSQLESKAKEKVKEDDLASPEWAVIDFQDLEKTREDPQDEAASENDAENEAEEAEEKATEGNAEGDAGSAPEMEGDECPRQFSNSHRSYLSMEYAPASTPGASERSSAACSPATAAAKSPHMVPSMPSRQVSETPKAGASPKMGSHSPVLQPQRDRGRSWADQLENSDEDDYGSAQTFGALDQSFQTPHMNGPPHGAPPSRRPPPQEKPPAAPQQRSGVAARAPEGMAPLPHQAPGRYAVPPVPVGPPPPPAQAGGGPHSRGGQQADGRRPSRADSPDYARAQAPSNDWRDDGSSSHGDSRDNDVRAAWGEPREAPHPPVRGWGSPDQEPPYRGKGRGPPPVHASPPSQHPPRQHQDWEPPRALGGKGGKGDRDEPGNCWGPAVACTPQFAPRAPVNRPMTEDFLHSGWKEKKLWEPEKSVGKGDRAVGNRPSGKGKNAQAAPTPADGKGGAARPPVRDAREEDYGASQGQPSKIGSGAVRSSEIDDEDSVPKKPKPPKVKHPKGSLEALDPDSSSDESGSDDQLPPEYAVLDLTVPRTALVINVSHVLKRLSGCCSLNQLNKALKSFKEKTGVTLECFLRANPMTFKLEGRVVYLVDRDGNKWNAPKQEGGYHETEQPAKGKGKGKGKAARGSGGDGGGGNDAQQGKGKSGKKGGSRAAKGSDEHQAWDHTEDASWGGEEKKPKRRGGKGGGKGGAKGKRTDDYEWSSYGWDAATEWSGSAWKSDGWSW